MCWRRRGETQGWIGESGVKMVQNGIGNPKFDKLLLRARCTLLLSVLVVPSCLTNFKWGG